jgi:hypothetical protein
MLCVSEYIDIAWQARRASCFLWIYQCAHFEHYSFELLAAHIMSEVKFTSLFLL